MLTHISLELFKCFRKLHLPLAQLTVLSGVNASGKSTVLQALTLLHQTLIANQGSGNLILNGECVSLGSAQDVINQFTGGRSFALGIESDQYECQWRFTTEDRLALSVPVVSVIGRDRERGEVLTSESMSGMHLFLPEFPSGLYDYGLHISGTLLELTYLSADRFGPREAHQYDAPDQRQDVGPRGERVVWYLDQFGGEPALSSLILPDFPPTIQRQVEAWMKQFFPGTTLQINRVPSTNLITLGIRTSDATEFHRPQNVGYGLSHVLPIITACLGAQSDKLLLIENPESHLHPSGQSAMGEFLARVAAAGVQLIIETHSDHILNGIRRAVKKQTLRPEAVAIHFFAPYQTKDESGDIQVISPLMDVQGNFDRWPEGFFDQFDKDTTTLLGWG